MFGTWFSLCTVGSKRKWVFFVLFFLFFGFFFKPAEHSTNHTSGEVGGSLRVESWPGLQTA